MSRRTSPLVWVGAAAGVLVAIVLIANVTNMWLASLRLERRIAALQAAFLARNALQCGFCTPAMLLTAAALLKENPAPTRPEIREYLSGNFCRCTAYQAIVDAVESAASETKGTGP